MDEIQRTPQLLSYIQETVDVQEAKGRYILTGSHQLAPHEAITQSLAGRTALLTLLPMSLRELASAGQKLSVDSYLLHGFYPRIYKDNLDPTKAYRNYVQMYIERDVRQLIRLSDLDTFGKFLKLCAGRIGQVVNMQSLGNETGVSSTTIKQWLSVLEASFVIYRLTPYFENFGKRIIKAPKLYFTDVGLAAYLLGIENTTQMSRDPLRGNLVENMVIMELVKSRCNVGADPQLYFYRDHHHNEVDVIWKSGNNLIPIEIKASSTLHSDFFKGISFFRDLVKKRSPYGFLIYTGEQEQKVQDVLVLNYHNAFRVMTRTHLKNTIYCNWLQTHHSRDRGDKRPGGVP